MLCSACKGEYYCSPDCQKTDWKIHKILCKSMSNKVMLMVLKEVNDLSLKMFGYARADRNIDFAQTAPRIMLHTLSFAREHFGKRIVGKSCHISKKNEFFINNWEVEIEIIEKLCFSIGDRYEVLHTNGKLYLETYRKLAFSNYEECLIILEPWHLQLDLPESDRVDRLPAHKRDHILHLLSSREDVMG
jgi:hypothetical protein